MEQYPSVKAPKKRTNKAGKVLSWLARYRDLEAGKVVERSVGTRHQKRSSRSD